MLFFKEASIFFTYKNGHNIKMVASKKFHCQSYMTFVDDAIKVGVKLAGIASY